RLFYLLLLYHINWLLLESDIVVGMFCVATIPPGHSRKSLITSATKLLLCLPRSLERSDFSQIALPESLGHSCCWINLIPVSHKEG
ncbi:hypothetical protein HispidOSU_011136, partial [Sigmodon hispidus]